MLSGVGYVMLNLRSSDLHVTPSGGRICLKAGDRFGYQGGSSTHRQFAGLTIISSSFTISFGVSDDVKDVAFRNKHPPPAESNIALRLLSRTINRIR